MVKHRCNLIPWWRSVLIPVGHYGMESGAHKSGITEIPMIGDVSRHGLTITTPTRFGEGKTMLAEEGSGLLSSRSSDINLADFGIFGNSRDPNVGRLKPLFDRSAMRLSSSGGKDRSNEGY